MFIGVYVLVFIGGLNDIHHFHRFSVSAESFSVFEDEFNNPFFESEKGVVVSAFDVFAGDEFRSALADDNVADFRFLAAEKFHAEPLAFRIAA